MLQFQSQKVRAGTKRAVIYYSEKDCFETHKAFRTSIKTKATVRIVVILHTVQGYLSAASSGIIVVIPFI